MSNFHGEEKTKVTFRACAFHQSEYFNLPFALTKGSDSKSYFRNLIGK